MAVLDRDAVRGMNAEQVRAAMNTVRDDVASIREKNGGTLEGVTGADAETIRENMTSMNNLGERRDELADMAAAEATFAQGEERDPASRHPGHNGGAAAAGVQNTPVDAGGLFLESNAYRAWVESGALNVPATVPVSAVFGRSFQGIGEIPGDELRVNAALFDSTGFPTRQDIRPTPVEVLYQQNNIGPLMPQGSTDSDTIRYPVETVTATGAAEVAEGATKPEAQISFADTDEPVQTIAVLLPMTNKSLRNQPFLRAWVNSRLRLFLQNREDSQLLNGNGTTPNLKGILNRSGINTATSYSIGGANPDQALVDAFFKASMRVRDAFLEPTAAVTKPSTWEIAALAKDANRNYLLGGPGAAGYAGMDPASGPRIWGMRVVLNANMPAQSATNKVGLVGAWDTAAMIVRRGGIELAISESHGTFFAENKVMLRAEEELALCVFRPAGFAAITSAA